MLTVWRLAQVCRVQSRWLALEKHNDRQTECIYHFARHLTVRFLLNTVLLYLSKDLYRFIRLVEKC